MSIVGVVLTIFCGVTALISAMGKLTQQEPVVKLLDEVNVDGALRQALPFIQIAGGVGALVGLVVLPALGIAALIGLALYFVGAVVFHLRVGGGIAEFGIPLGLAALMAATAVIRAATI